MREIWQITVQAADDGTPPVAVRVRMLLKRMLRSHRLRCVDFRAVGAEAVVRQGEVQQKKTDAPETM